MVQITTTSGDHIYADVSLDEFDLELRRRSDGIIKVQLPENGGSISVMIDAIESYREV